MQTKEIQSAFEELSEEFKKQYIPSYEEEGKDYNTTKENHEKLIEDMKQAFYDKLKDKFRITVSKDGPFDTNCTYLAKILLSYDEKHIIQDQKLKLKECALRALDVSSEKGDLNQSDQADTRNRKTQASNAIKPFQEDSLTSVYSYSKYFEMLATDFYTENTRNLIHDLTTRGFSEKQLQTIHDVLSEECRKLTMRDSIKYKDMITSDTNRSYQDLIEAQGKLFLQMDSVLEKNSHTNQDFFGVLSPEERKIHVENALKDYENSKSNNKDEKTQEKPTVQSLPDCILD